MKRLWDLYYYLSNADNWCEPEDRCFYKLFLWFVAIVIWILIGTYIYDEDMLLIFFWPFNL